MQFTLRSVLTLALLRLSSLVPSTYGATTGLAQVGDVPRSELVHGAAGLSKRSRSRCKRCQPGGASSNAGGDGANANPNHPGVVNLQQLQCTVAPNPGQDTPTEKTYRVSSASGTMGDFCVSTSQGTVTIDDVDLEKDNRPREEKSMTYQVVMALKNHSSIPWTRPRSEGAGRLAYRGVLFSDPTDLDRELYIDFLTTSFGKNAVGMSAVPQFGKQLTRVDVSSSSSGVEGSYNMEFFYDESDESAGTED